MELWPGDRVGVALFVGSTIAVWSGEEVELWPGVRVDVALFVGSTIAVWSGERVELWLGDTVEVDCSGSMSLGSA